MQLIGKAKQSIESFKMLRDLAYTMQIPKVIVESYNLLG